MLTGKQKRYLRSLGSVLEPVVHVGKAGVDDAVVRSVAEVLMARELVKVRTLRNCPQEPQEVLALLAGETGAHLVQTIGRNGLLYKRNSEKPKVELPT